MSIKNGLVGEFNDELARLGTMELGSDNYKLTLDGVTKLADRVIELEKVEIEREEKEKDREFDRNLRIQQIKDEKKDRIIKNCITVGTAVGSLAVYIWAFVASTNFEKEGTLTTEGGRSSLRKLLNLKF